MSMLEIQNLKVFFHTPDGVVKAVDSVDLMIGNGEHLGLIGETGCGKTVLGISILRIKQTGAVAEGQITYQGRDLMKLEEEEMRRLRGKEIAMILQNPANSLNPVYKVGDQIAEAVILHCGWSKKEAWHKVMEILDAMGVQEPAKHANQYPHELSGGMKEKVMIAMSLASGPRLVIADEPTKGLDGKSKAQIMDLIRKTMSGRSMIMITHDLNAAREICDRVAVMYAGELIEVGPSKEVLSDPLHPYVKALVNSLPNHGFNPIRGNAPSLIEIPQGCRFHPRCDYAFGECRKQHPEMKIVGNGRSARCLLFD